MKDFSEIHVLPLGSGSGMKILLRNQETKRYYAGDHGWKLEPDHAVPFPSSMNAWKLALANFHGQPMELVYSFQNPDENLFVPIEPCPEPVRQDQRKRKQTDEQSREPPL
ncbi:MAG TPA: hypothetical protein VK327_16500 [Candidatus Paceibacterota bacterium]|nr:hypothetical protein [Candidatus Paceibacterota bacterium]